MTNLQIIPDDLDTTKNNGGQTDYYSLPKVDKQYLTDYLLSYKKGEVSLEETVNKIYKGFPSTLLDLIEYKQMQPWQHEVMKANYALNERALKNPKKGSSKLREVNKILYYANRGKNLILNEENIVEKAKPHFKIKIQSPITKQEEEND